MKEYAEHSRNFDPEVFFKVLVSFSHGEDFLERLFILNPKIIEPVFEFVANMEITTFGEFMLLRSIQNTALQSFVLRTVFLPFEPLFRTQFLTNAKEFAKQALDTKNNQLLDGVLQLSIENVDRKPNKEKSYQEEMATYLIELSKTGTVLPNVAKAFIKKHHPSFLTRLFLEGVR